ncbi:uncharacterized protein [Choristoneura fumiferana]|uniref:uncharacterized protein n=1 Tax=Choristoneura fumiferana TaxID=7141 RepID=UPI003D155EA4
MTTPQRYQGYPYSTPRVTEVSDRPSVTATTPTTPTSAGREAARYQGYPYTNPHVHDAPSIDAATANRWAHLPRKPLEARNNVIYVDMPEEGSSQVTRPMPGASQSRGPPDKKTDIDDNPVIYIDVPESGCSDVAAPVEPEAEPAYVQETIFYNPFENRRIDQEKDADSMRSSDSDSVGSGTPRPLRPAPGRPTPPNTLNLTSPGSSSGYGSTYTTPGLPASMSKEAYVYRQQSPDDFPLSPIPISEFPQPPPAYTEIESPRVGSPVQSGVLPVTVPVSVPPAQEPPRTVVITPGTTDGAYRQRIDEPSPIGLPNPFRKVVYCHHCGLRVHTLVIRQTGTATHVVALTALCVGLIPITILVYCTDTCKNKNHYCPNCNKMIGYEVPILCQNMTFTK